MKLYEKYSEKQINMLAMEAKTDEKKEHLLFEILKRYLFKIANSYVRSFKQRNGVGEWKGVIYIGFHHAVLNYDIKKGGFKYHLTSHVFYRLQEAVRSKISLFKLQQKDYRKQRKIEKFVARNKNLPSKELESKITVFLDELEATKEEVNCLILNILTSLWYTELS